MYYITGEKKWEEPRQMGISWATDFRICFSHTHFM